MKRLRKKTQHRRRKIYNVTTFSFKEPVLKVAQDLYLLFKTWKGSTANRNIIYSSKSLSAYPKCQINILFLHAITGRDTTPAMFRRGKTSILKLFEEKNLIDWAKVFEEIDSSPQTKITKGIRFLLAVYGAPKKINCIDKYRYLTFVKKHGTRNKYNYLVFLQHRLLLINTCIEYTIKFRHA